jgi:hypothetical protein
MRESTDQESRDFVHRYPKRVSEVGEYVRVTEDEPWREEGHQRLLKAIYLMIEHRTNEPEFCQGPTGAALTLRVQLEISRRPMVQAASTDIWANGGLHRSSHRPFVTVQIHSFGFRREHSRFLTTGTWRGTASKSAQTILETS